MKYLITILLLVGLAKVGNAGEPEIRDSLVSYAGTFKGVPYQYGGTSATGFDCSGFVYYVFKNFNYSVPRTSASYNNFGTSVALDSCKVGDVIVFTGTNASIRKPGHLGIVYRNDNGIIDFIHASSSKKNYGVTITRYNGSGYEKRFLSVVNVFDV